MRRHTYVVATALLLVISVAAGLYSYSSTKFERMLIMQPYSIPEDCDFSQVVARGFGRAGRGHFSENVCTPIIHDLKFVGIVINAPKVVHFITTSTEDGENAIPVSGLIRHDLGTFIGGKNELNLAETIVFVVKDTRTNDVWHGKIPGPQNLVPKPKPKDGNERKLTPEEMKGRILGEVFNPNLFDITSLQLRETEYLVYATVGPYKSNVVTIKTIKDKD